MLNPKLFFIFLIVAIFFGHFTLDSMELDASVIVPYAAASYIIDQNDIKKIKNMPAVLPYAIASYLIDRHVNEQFITDLTTNPASVHTTIGTTLISFIASTKSLNYCQQLSQKSFSSLYQQYKAICPLFFLDECAHKECSLSRCNNSSRSAFEQRASLLLLSQIRSYPKQPIRYASVGAEGTLLDTIIMAKTLLREPSAHLFIDFIDLQYDEFISKKNDHNDCYKVTYNPDIVLNDYNDTSTTLLLILQQCIQWLTQAFPQARISLSAYSSCDKYMHHLQETEQPFPHLVVGADLYTIQKGTIIDGRPDWEKLARYSLWYNQSATSLLLERNLGKTYLTSVSPQSLTKTNCDSSTNLMGTIYSETI